MRSIFVLMISLSLVVLPCLGCGGGDPTDDPGFVDSADPESTDPGGGLPPDPGDGLSPDPGDDPTAGGAPANE